MFKSIFENSDVRKQWVCSPKVSNAIAVLSEIVSNPCTTSVLLCIKKFKKINVEMPVLRHMCQSSSVSPWFEITDISY